MPAETQHTPGPWMVASKGYGWDHFAAIITPSGIVANCHIAALSRSHEQTAADARLIVAAPDLLAVAQMVVNASEVAGVSGALGDAARYAIAKATDHAR